MNTWGERRGMLAALGVLALAASTGCVSNSTYQLAKSNAENAKLLYLNEQRRAQELSATVKQQKLEMESLEATLRETREKLGRTDREWRETRDELLKLKIEQEQRHKGRQRLVEAQPTLEAEKAAVAAEVEARFKQQAESEDAKRRLKELMQQLQSVLQQF